MGSSWYRCREIKLQTTSTTHTYTRNMMWKKNNLSTIFERVYKILFCDWRKKKKKKNDEWTMKVGQKKKKKKTKE